MSRQSLSIPRQALTAAIVQAGGFAALARQLGITPQAVHKWRQVPAERVLAIEQLTGVSRHRLRPDIYPPGL